MLALQQNSHNGDNNPNNNNNRQKKNENSNKEHYDKRKANFSKRNVFQKNQSFNFRNKASKPSQPGAPSNVPQNGGQSVVRNPSIQLSHKDSPTNIGLISPQEHALDGAIGGFSTNMPQIQNRFTERPLPKFLLYQPPTLDASDFLSVDQWDRDNQSKMVQLEQSASDLSSLYEDFQKMREHEREVMEQKGLVDNENIRRSLENAIVFKGSCHDMCPVYERIRRSVENDVRNFERDPKTKKISKSRAIKAFSRPAAGQPPPLPSDVRPPQVLVETLDYIIENLSALLPDSQSFLWDRTRSIRQDFTYQNYLGPEAVDCNEKIVRIHILTLHIMAETHTEYSQQQELEQMNKALKTLSEMYTEYRSRGVSPPNEGEFRAYYMLSQIRDPELEREVEALPAELLNDEKIQIVLQMRNLISMNIVERGFQSSENILNSFTAFFDMINNKRIPVLMCFLLEIHLNEIRFYALRSIKKAIHNKAKGYPLAMIQNLLAFNDESDLVDFCSYYGIVIEESKGVKEVDVLSLKHNSHSIPDQKPFRQSFSNKFSSSISSYQDLINTGTMNTGLIQFKDYNRSLSIQPSISASTNYSAAPEDSLRSLKTFPSNIIAPPTEPSGRAALASEDSTVQKFTSTQAEKTKQKNELTRSQEFSRLEKEREEKELRRKRQEQEKAREEHEKLETMKRVMLERQEIKKQKKADFISLIGKKLQQDLVTNVVRQQFEKTIRPIVEKRVEAKQEKKKLIEAFGDGLYEAFVNELVYFQSLVILSDIFRERMLKKRLIKRIADVSKKCKQLDDLKKRKREEFLDVIENFGVPRLIKKKKVNKNLSYSEISNISTSTSVGSIPTPKPKQSIDLKPFEINKLLSTLSENPKKPYNILIHVDEPIISRLFNRKFRLVDNSKVYSQDGKEILVVNKTTEINSNLFSNVNLLVFNLVEMKNFDGKKLELRELLQGIQLNNSYKFEVLIIYWELDNNHRGSILNYGKRDILKGLNIPKNDNILKVEFIKVGASLNLYEIENYLNTIGDVQLSSKGLFNERYNSNSGNQLKNKDQANFKKTSVPLNISYPSHFDVVEDKYTKKFRPHIEASTKYRGLPKLFSDQNSASSSDRPKSEFKIDVYSTPRPKSSELLQTPSYYDSSSISTFSNVTFGSKDKEELIIKKPTYAEVASGLVKEKKRVEKVESNDIIPKSIQELRDLAKKVRERHCKE